MRRLVRVLVAVLVTAATVVVGVVTDPAPVLAHTTQQTAEGHLYGCVDAKPVSPNVPRCSGEELGDAAWGTGRRTPAVAYDGFLYLQCTATGAVIPAGVEVHARYTRTTDNTDQRVRLQAQSSSCSQVESGPAGMTTFPTTEGTRSLPMFSSTSPFPQQRRLEYFYYVPAGTALGSLDPGFPPIGSVESPQLLCERELKDQGNGWTMDLRGTVLNPQQHTTDTMELVVPWETTARPGKVAQGVQLPALSSMPAGGWRGLCVVTRTYTGNVTVLNPTASGSGADPWSSPQGSIETGDCASRNPDGTLNFTCLAQHNVGTQAFVGTPPMVTAPSPWLTVGAGAGAGAAAAAGGLTIGTGGLILGGAVVVGGALWLADRHGLIDVLPDGCGLMERFGGWLGGDGCPSPQELETPYLRQQVQYLLPDGTPMTKAQLQANKWATAIAVAEVLINPAKPHAGTKTVTALQPRLVKPATPTEQAEYAKEAAAEPTHDVDADGEGCGLSLNPLNGFGVFRALKCALKWAFVPKASYTDLLTGLEDEFPFSVAYEVVTGGQRLKTAATGGKDGGDACGTIDVRSILKSGAPAEIGTKLDGFVLHLPTPSTSGCPGWSGGARTTLQDKLGDGLGFRVVVRSVAAIFLYFAVMMGVVRAFLDEDPKALEPG